MALKKSCMAFGLLVLMSCSVFYTAEKVATTQMRVSRLQAKATKVQENLDVLAAEWQFLTSPTRLEKLAANNFGLAAQDGTQLAALSEVPTWQTMETLALENVAPETAPQNDVMMASAQAPTQQVAQPVAQPVAMPAPQPVANLAITNVSMTTP